MVESVEELAKTAMEVCEALRRNGYSLQETELVLYMAHRAVQVESSGRAIRASFGKEGGSA